jgi:hypothetical protein
MDYLTKIQDLLIKSLPTQTIEGVDTVPLLAFDDHLLRRFGRMEWIHLQPESRSQPFLRQVADEIWIVLSGGVDAYWHDRRLDSPTLGVHEHRYLDANSFLLLPFGIAFGCQTGHGESTLLRVMTHDPDSTDDARAVAWEELRED